MIWAYNPEHLEQLEAWINAPLRQRRPHEQYGWSNASFFSRLPRWIKLAKNRAEVARALKRLRAMTT